MMTAEETQKLKEIAIEIASPYPDIENVSPWEQLYAIKSSFDGVSKACDDYYVMFRILVNRAGLTLEEGLKLSDEVRKLRGFVGGKPVLSDAEIIEKLSNV